ncbi:hypothetical protein TCAL_06207 [Tigriopus californicus]|uniref:Uncharacterized protein n=1 Tax=Tigriopus californicus TaxID=6832 RepID=A0A553NSL6_TIGCA|nr:uncharacterized protein LOC131893625 [Tigriopus californicus]TRY68408.1 hypothetical protein TCAL_06207 [Tigriopus californicus]|eukprot:TCALIF_06207-PA protein Name:"Protein of unknown function" AED:0.00 eAED:0.00 QI:165/1/1/1/0.33/0.5/4/522/168
MSMRGRGQLSQFEVLFSLFFIVIAIIALECNASTVYFPEKRVPGGNYNDCLDSNGMERQLRSDGLNSYLFGLARCITSVGRPRFGKRSGSPSRKGLLPSKSAMMKSLYQLEPSQETNPNNLHPLERQISTWSNDWLPLDEELARLIWNTQDYSERSKRQDEITFEEAQ